MHNNFNIIQARISDGPAPSKGGRDLRKYPLIDKQGRIREFPVYLASQFLRSTEVMQNEPDEVKGTKLYERFAKGHKYAVQGWRNLSDEQYQMWQSSEVKPERIEVPNDEAMRILADIDAKKSAELAAKDAEIAKLKAMLEASKKGSEGVKNPAADGKVGPQTLADLDAKKSAEIAGGAK